MKDRPGIVIVVLDSVRRDHLSSYGYRRPTTPSIDRVAAEGITFRNAYAAAPWTIPSHASLFTGLYPAQHRADLDTRHLDDRHATLAGLASAAGYRTACFTANGFISHHTNLDRGFETSVDIRRPGPFQKGILARVSRGAYRRWHGFAGRDRGSERLTRFARRWLRETATEGPFLLFLNYMDCHLPYRLRTADRYRFVDPAHRTRADSVPQDPFATMARGERLSQQQISDLKDLYDGALFHLDRQIGLLDDELQRLKLWDRTAFLVTSDHGESFGEHGLLDHQYGLWEHLIAVPLILRLPGRQRAGERHAALVQHTDLLATVAEWAGFTVPEPARAQSVDIFAGKKRAWCASEYLVPNLRTLRRRAPDADLERFDRSFRSFRDERHKLIVSRGGERHLFDLAEDPNETNDMATAAPDLAESLAARLEQELGPWPTIHGEGTIGDVDPELRSRLEALGYL